MTGGIKFTSQCVGYQQITSVGTAVGLTVPSSRSSGGKANYAVIVAEGDDVRWRDDGISPSATVGMPLAAGERLQYDGDLNAIKFIEQAGGATLNISYYL